MDVEHITRLFVKQTHFEAVLIQDRSTWEKMAHDGTIWAPVFFLHQLLWCSGVTPNFPPNPTKRPQTLQFSHFMPGFCCTGWLGWNPFPSENRFAGKNGCCCGTTTFWIYDHSCQSNVCDAPRPSFFNMNFCYGFSLAFRAASFGFFSGGDFVGIERSSVFNVSIWENYSKLIPNGGSQTYFDPIWGWSWHDPGWWTIM